MTFEPTRSLVTGASSGIGAVFARELARRGSDVVLVARREDRLQALADELRRDHGSRVQVIAADLTRPGAVAEVLSRLEGPVNCLVNNAGFGTYGHFADGDPARFEDEVDLDVRAVVGLSRATLPAMLEAGTGAIVNIASTAAAQPIPGMAVYSAAKAFVLSFSHALWFEARPAGVKVLAVSPGPTSTEFFDVLGSHRAAVGTSVTPEHVVARALKALDRRDSPPGVTVTSPMSHLAAVSARILPRRLVIPLAARAVGLGARAAGPLVR